MLKRAHSQIVVSDGKIREDTCYHRTNHLPRVEEFCLDGIERLFLKLLRHLCASLSTDTRDGWEAALLRMEPLTPRKTAGVVIASVGVAVALLADLGTTPAGAWRGDLFMVTALAHHSHNDAVALKLEATSSNCSRARGAGDPSSCLKLANTQGTRPDAQRIALETRGKWRLLAGRYDYSSSLPPSRRKASSFSRWR